MKYFSYTIVKGKNLTHLNQAYVSLIKQNNVTSLYLYVTEIYLNVEIFYLNKYSPYFKNNQMNL